MRSAILIAALAASVSGSRWAAAQTADSAADAAEPTAAATDGAAVAAGAASDAPANVASPGVAAASPATDPAKIEAERKAFWSSPEMVEAREWVLEYGRRSRRLGEQGAQDYLARVERLTPTAMSDWLSQLNARRGNLARSAEFSQVARQRMVDQTFQRLQALRESQVNAARNRDLAAEEARNQLLFQRQFAEDLSAVRQATRNDFLSQMYYGRDYSWLAFPPYRMRAAAAATLPGDLPANDPRNFLRDVPVDANGNITGPAGDAGAAAANAAAAAAGVGPGGGPNVGAGAGGAP